MRIKIHALLCPIEFFETDQEEDEEDENEEDKSRKRVCMILARDFGQLLVDEQWRRSVRLLQSEPILPDQMCIDFKLQKADEVAKNLLNEQSVLCEAKRDEDKECEKTFMRTITTRFEDEKMNSTIKIKK